MNFAMSLMQAFHPAAIGPFVMIIVVLVIIGLCLWLLFKYVPMDPPIKVVIQAIVVLCLILWLLRSFGII